MDENEIRIVITGVASDLRRALDGAKGDLGGLKAAIKDVPNQIKVDVNADTAVADERLRRLKDAARDVPNRINIQADADTAGAMGKLAMLRVFARETAGSIGGLFGGGGGGGGGGGSLGGLLPGVAPSTGAVAAAAPLIAGGIGAATSVAGSAGAAALGAGALGTAGVGSLAAGIGPLLALSGGLKDAIALSGQLETAQQKLEATQKLYGANSTQAASAQKALNLLMAEADPAVLAFAKSLQAVNEKFSDAEQKLLPAFAATLKPILDTFGKLLPTIERMAKIDLRGLSAGLKPLLEFMDSSAFKGALLDLSRTFAQLAGPLGQAFTNLMRAFLSVAVAASPFLVQIANAFERWTASFAQSLAPGKALNDLIGGLVSQLHSWFNLATSIGSLMITIFSAGASTGQSLVNMLTGLVRQWNAWLNTKAGQQAMKTFFTDSKNLVVALVEAFGPLALALTHLIVNLLPTLTGLLKALTPLFDGLAVVIDDVAKAITGKLVSGILILWLKAVALAVQAPIVAFGVLKTVVGALATAFVDAWEFMKKAFSKVLDFILGGISTLLGAIKAVVDAANINLPIVGHLFGDLGKNTSTALGIAQTSIDNFRKTLHPTSQDVKSTTDQIGGSFSTMTGNVIANVSHMVAATSQGLNAVDVQVAKALLAYGVKWNKPALGLPNTSALTPNPPAGVTLKAGGGLVGSWGERGRDLVPAMLGAGEAVLNHPQQAIANQYLAPIGGLPGLFDRTKGSLHHLAAGGFAGGGVTAAQANTATGAGGTSAYVSPFPKGTPITWERQDAGKDMVVPPGTPVLAIGDGRITGIDPNWFRGQPLIEQSLSGGPEAGKFVYYAEGLTSRVGAGQSVKAGQVIGITTSQPTGLEFGWGGGGTSTLRSVVAGRGDSAGPWSSSYEAFIRSLVAGHTITVAGIPGGIGGVSAPQWQNIAAPKWNGPGGAIGAIGQGALRKVTDAANTFGQSKIGGISGGGTFSGTLNGSAEHMIAQFFGAAGMNKTAIAGLIGNAVQESGLNWSTPGGGMWQQISNFGQGAPAPLVQMSTMLGQIRGLIGPMNNAGSPGNAAAIFMNQFERPNAALANLPRRIAAANQAFAQGYARGGIVPGLAGGGTVVRGPVSWFNDHTTASGIPADTTAGISLRIPGTSFGDARNRALMRHMFDVSIGQHHGTFPDIDLGPNESTGRNIDVGIKALYDMGFTTGNFPTGAIGTATMLGAGAKRGASSSRPLTGSGLSFTGHKPLEFTGVIRDKLLGPPPLQTLAGYGTKLGLLEADILSKSNQFGSLSGRFGALEADPKFLNPDGSTNAAGIARQVADTKTLLALAKGILADEQQELPLVKTALRRFLGNKAGTEKTITADTAKIALNKRRIAANKLREGSLRTALLDLQKPTADQAGAISRAIRAAKAKYDPAIQKAQAAKDRYHGKNKNTRAQLADALTAARQAEYGIVHPLEESLIVAQSKQSIHKSQVRSESFRLRQQLNALTLDDKRLGASDTSVATGIATLKSILTGAGGAQGGAQGENVIISSLESVAGKLGTVQWGAGGSFAGIDTRNQGVAFDEQTTIDQLQNTLTRLGAAVTPAGPDLSALNALLTTQLQQTQQALALSQSQFGIFQGFAPLVGQRLLGSFATGIDRVPQTGPYLLHRDEMVIPDPSGPQSNRAAATVHTASGPVNIELHFENNDQPLVKLIDARMNQHALRIVSDHSGQRARLMSGVRRP